MKSRYVFLALSFILTGCLSMSQKEYLANHPELTAEEVKWVKRGYVRPGQNMEMVKAIYGNPYKQVAPGKALDLLIYWKQNSKTSSRSYADTEAKKQEADVLKKAIANVVDTAADKLAEDHRGTLTLVYFSGGIVSHIEARSNVLIDSVAASAYEFSQANPR